MASNMAHLAHLEPWYAEWLEPAHYEVYRGELDAALTMVAHAVEQFERENNLTQDERAVLAYELAWTPFNFISFLGRPEQEVEPWYRAAAAALDIPPAGPVSAPTQAFYQIALAAKAVSYGFAKPDLPALRRWLAAIPPERFNVGTWQHLAIAGFHLGDKQLVEEAFGELLTATTGLRDGYGWLRVNLMHLLVDGRSQPEDFRQLLAVIQHIGELRSFRRDFWPHAVRLGFAGRLEAQLESRDAELSAALLPPDLQPTTRRVLGRN
jgi:hypothetical protein